VGMNWIKEIRKVGIIDWIWFVIYLRRNEFSNKLNLSRYYTRYGALKYPPFLIKDRQKAHEIDLALMDLK
jgi:hypothetical protein